jgi:dTDP-4-dehydrorhamnose 3,5-epimerase
MKITHLSITGSALITPNPIEDERGFFAPLVNVGLLEELGKPFKFWQMNASLSKKKGTLRGLHMQKGAASETKVIRLIKGSIWDVIVDMRPTSSTYLQWVGITLLPEERQILIVPPGCAHGFITLEDETEIVYLVDKTYAPELEVVFRWDDPLFDIKWPIPPTLLSLKDKSAPFLDKA